MLTGGLTATARRSRGDGDDRLPAKALDLLESLTSRIIIRKTKASEAIGSLDQAQQRFAKGTDPGSHGGDVAFAGIRRAIGMRMQEADDVPMFFLSREDRWTVKLDARWGTYRAS